MLYYYLYIYIPLLLNMETFFHCDRFVLPIVTLSMDMFIFYALLLSIHSFIVEYGDMYVRLQMMNKNLVIFR